MVCDRCGLNIQNGSCRRCLYYSQYLVDLDECDEFAQESVCTMPFELTVYQKDIANRLCSLIEHSDVFLEAVCGAGKTEICLPLIEKTLKDGKCVCWAVPRREIVLELFERFKSYFKTLKIACVCGGRTNDLVAPFVICTTHQLYRYSKQFDLLILDEPDAFPFANNDLLLKFVIYACKKRIVYLSATYNRFLEDLCNSKSVKHLYASLRPSGRLLPIPTYIHTCFPFLRMMIEYRRFKKDHLLIFVPTRRIARILSFLLGVPLVTSQTKNREVHLDHFRKFGGVLVCTTVLERGVTFKKCNVFVLYADHPIFDTASLIQIAGRVERGINPVKGVCMCFFLELTPSLKKSKRALVNANKHATSVLKKLALDHSSTR
ncbi:DEAD/DEAH box helicase [Erysipelothrix rhusiopathiae]|nr:DEAD/DEAH box helicase [Erysipelothrix rhusiopathiae]